MRHDPEGAAAEYFASGMDERRRAAFSAHLLACDDCWHELQAVRAGRRIVEAIRAVAPAELRERVRALVLAQSGLDDAAPARRRYRSRWLLAVPVAAAAVLAVALLLGVPDRATSGRADPAALAAAVRDFRAQELPGRRLPAAGAPDLTAVRLVPVGSGGGSYAGLAVDGYAYRDAVGRRLVLYLSPEPFPAPVEALRLQGPDGSWTVRRDGVVVLCARAPHAMLVMGQDEQLVALVARELAVL